MCEPYALEKNSKGRILQGMSHMKFKESMRILPQGKANCNIKTGKAELLKLCAVCNVKTGKAKFCNVQPTCNVKTEKRDSAMVNLQKRDFTMYKTHTMENQQ